VKLILPALLLACSCLLSAQNHKPSRSGSPAASTLISIHVTGSTRYAPDQIIAASGLRPGQSVNEEDFKGVSQQLGETGAFSDVAYSFKFDPAGIRLELQVRDGGPFLPARFENFVWFSPQELSERLRARVPLFQGELPVAGNLADQVSEALQGIAIEQKLQGRVDYLRAGPQDGPLEAFEFSISGQPITIRHVDFTGAGAAELPALEAAARRMSGQDYSSSLLVLAASKDFLPVFLARGYLKAAIAEPQPKVAEQTAEETRVDVTFPVTPGRQYKLTGIELSGYTNVFTVEQLRQLIHMQTGQPANAVQADQDVAALKKLYGTRGYMGVQIRPAPEMNDADSTVKYTFQFKEGSIYKMGDLEIRGLDSKATERMVSAWRLLPGQTYDAGYTKQFLDSMLGLYPEDQWKITVRETTEDQDKVVDVSLRFDAKR
jgi:outer membrane protein assembly factor BamA